MNHPAHGYHSGPRSVGVPARLSRGDRAGGRHRVVGAAGSYPAEAWMRRVGEHVVHDLRIAVYGQLHRLSLRYGAANSPADLVTRLTSAVNAVGELTAESLVKVAGAVFLLAGMLAVSPALDPDLTVAAAAVTPVLAVATVRARRTVKGPRAASVPPRGPSPPSAPSRSSPSRRSRPSGPRRNRAPGRRRRDFRRAADGCLDSGADTGRRARREPTPHRASIVDALVVNARRNGSTPPPQAWAGTGATMSSAIGQGQPPRRRGWPPCGRPDPPGEPTGHVAARGRTVVPWPVNPDRSD